MVQGGRERGVAEEWGVNRLVGVSQVKVGGGHCQDGQDSFDGPEEPKDLAKRPFDRPPQVNPV